MPMLIEHIDAIARKIGRGVLFVGFPACSDISHCEGVGYRNYEPRKIVIQWLDQNGVKWKPCAEIADENCMLPYGGTIYIDVPFDENDPVYKKVDAFLAHEDATPKIEGAIFYYLPLEIAMRNKHHDEPGFWEKACRLFFL